MACSFIPAVGSLFSGAGLCDLGFHRAGFRHRFFCEADGWCRSVLARHWPGVPIYTDVRDLDPATLPRVEVLSGGFPCQDVSCGGKRAGITATTRSGLWHEYKRIIEGVRPRYAVIENVKGLLSKGMDRVLSDLSGIGYDAEWQSVPAAAFGAPHLRERVFVVAYPHGSRADRACGVLSASQGELAEYVQYDPVSDWLGIRIDRASREAIVKAYGAPCLYRVDDGRSAGLDGATGQKPCLPVITQAERKAWIPRLKALGNGISPQQSEFVARAICLDAGWPVDARVSGR